jgi:hypothetical protein
MANLKDDGFRFVRRGSSFGWVHPAEVQADDLDCTDMDDDEFENAVREVQATTKAASPPTPAH